VQLVAVVHNGPQSSMTMQAPIRVLLISLFHPELVRGGAQQICYELFEELKQQPGVEPILLASIDNTYPALFKSGACITGFDGREDEYLFLMQDYDFWWHKTSSPRMVEAFVEFLHTVRPDVVHFHHFFTFGVDFLTLTRRELPDVRIVFTFHEFMSICAADGQMVRKTDRSLCTHASNTRCHQCFPDRSPEQFLMRRQWMLRHLSVVDAFTCPSHFMLDFYERWGLPGEKLHHITNGQRRYGLAQPSPPGPKKRFGFFGQMVDNKGIQIILRAVRLLRAQGFTDFIVEINGENIRWASAPVRDEVEAFLEAEQALAPEEQIVFHNGGYHIDDLAARMARVDWCIVPSIWWEIFGLVISEAWMFGKPVICSNRGGPGERVEHDVGGLQFQLGDPRSLAETMRRAATENGLWERLVEGLPEPPSRPAMAAGFLRLYRGDAANAALELPRLAD
jgi:glycosyltransferase involved in cell wall biosynthesis